MNKLRILLDVDGVIADFDQFYLDCAVRAGVIRETSVDADWRSNAWDVGNALGLTKDGKAEVWREIQRPEAGERMPAYPDAILAVKELVLFADVYFPTSPIYRSPSWEYDRYMWFKRHFNEGVADRLIFTKRKHLIAGQVFVDDKERHLQEWLHEWKGSVSVANAILWPHPYNNNEEGMYRPEKQDWEWLLALVKNMTSRGLNISQ